MYKTILVPVDLAEVGTAKPAIDAAVSLAAASEGTIRLIYVRSVAPVTYMEFIPPGFDEEQQRDAEQKLADVAAGIPLPSERVSATVRLAKWTIEAACSATLTAGTAGLPSAAIRLRRSLVFPAFRTGQITVAMACSTTRQSGGRSKSTRSESGKAPMRLSRPALPGARRRPFCRNRARRHSPICTLAISAPMHRWIPWP